MKNPFENANQENIPSVEVPQNLPIKSEETERNDTSENYRQTLEEFIQTPLLNSPAWESRLRAQIKSRIEEGAERGYLMAIRKAATALDPEKEKILNAAIMYELKNLDSVVDVPGYNKTIIMRLALDSLNNKGLIGESVKKIIDQKSLKEISSFLLNIPSANRNEYDLGSLANLAFERMDSEPEEYRKIMDLVKDDISKNIFTWRMGIFFNMDKYSSGVFNFASREILEQNPLSFNFYFKRLSEYLDTSNLPEYQAKSRNIEVEKIFEYSSVLKEAYETFLKRKKEDEQKAEQERNEIQERERLEREEQLQRERQIKEQRESEQLVIDQERLDKYADEWIKKIEGASVNTNLKVDDIITVGFSGSIQLLSKREFDIIDVGDGEFYNLRFLNNKQRSFSDGGELHGDYRFGKARLKEERLVKFSNTIRRMANSIENLSYPSAEDVYEKIAAVIGLNEKNISASDYEERIRKIVNVLNQIENIASDKEYAQILQIISYRLYEQKAELESKLAEILDNQSEIEKRESIMELKKDFLLNQVENQIDYLRELYSQESGLILDETIGRTSSDSGTHVGSVGVGMRQSMRMEQRLELKLSIMPENDYIELEMGDSLESIKNRAAMVNWVGPHEIAHLVDLAQEEKNTGEILKNKRPLIRKTLEGVSRKNIAELSAAVMHNAEECIIDGVGFKMAKEFGTASPLEENEEERLTSMLKGFNASLEVVEVISNKTDVDDLHGRIWTAAALFRMAAVGQKLLDAAAENGISTMLINEVEDKLASIASMFENINNELALISGNEAIENLMNIYGELFVDGTEIKL